MNINNPSQTNKFDYAFGDELQCIGANGEMLEAGGLISKIIGTKKSRSVLKEKLGIRTNKTTENITTSAVDTKQDEINSTQPESSSDSNLNTWLLVGGIAGGLLLTGIIIFASKKKA